MGAVRIGLVDSGAMGVPLVESAAFALDDDTVSQGPATPDRLGHGSRVAAILHHCAPGADLLVAQVFHDRLATTAAQVAAAIDWLVDRQVSVINLSLGLRESRASLEAACRRALAAGVILCAATPARGDPVYPAAYPGVLRVTGDARCDRLEFAALGAAHADFGAHVRPLDGSLDGAGASMACAHLSGHLGRFLAGAGQGCPPGDAVASVERDAVPAATLVLAWLVDAAHYRGLERRRADGRPSGGSPSGNSPSTSSPS